MKRLQILIDEDLDDALEREALACGTSKAALIRQFVREQLGAPPPPKSDPIWTMCDKDDYQLGDIDDVVYR